MGGNSLPSIPLVVSNSRGGITSRLLPNGYSAPAASTEQEEESANGTPNGEAGPDGLGAARMGAGMMHSRVRRLDDVERIGNLVTLDLKGNDLRVSYFEYPLCCGVVNKRWRLSFPSQMLIGVWFDEYRGG